MSSVPHVGPDRFRNKDAAAGVCADTPAWGVGPLHCAPFRPAGGLQKIAPKAYFLAIHDASSANDANFNSRGTCEHVFVTISLYSSNVQATDYPREMMCHIGYSTAGSLQHIR